jgi:hypothetical protein
MPHYERHGDTQTAEYKCWRSMLNRCSNANLRIFKYYGGRGITVCERWRNRYVDFLADMGRRPSHEHSIDRIDNDGNYEPGNCRWATKSEQELNKRPKSEEHRARIGAAQKMRHASLSPEVRANLTTAARASKGFNGWKHSPEAIAKITAAAKARPPLSVEHRAKLAAAATARWERARQSQTASHGGKNG